MRRRAILTVIVLYVVMSLQAMAKIHITHRYANTDARSLIGLPMGSEKTIIDKQGNLRWSQWSIRHREPEVPFGISEQMDGALDLGLAAAYASGRLEAFKVAGQELYQGRFPFVVTRLSGTPALAAEELAFPAEIYGMGLDVVRITLTNSGPDEATVEARFSGKTRNLPAFVEGTALATRNGRLVVLGEAEQGEWGPAGSGLVLRCRVALPPHSSRLVWLKRPHDMLVNQPSALPGISGPSLLKQAEQAWQDFWDAGLKVDLPEKEVTDFLYSSLAYLFILCEYDAQGDLWTLDGPGLYRHFWPRSELYMALGMDMYGHSDLAAQTIQHLLRVQKDDGRWDMPLLNAPFSWDGLGDAAGTVWNHFLFARDRQWLWGTYPHLLSAAHWIRYNRQQTEIPSDMPDASKSVKPYLSYPCMEVPSPPLGPGEKPYTWGLLPMGYGDSGLPDDHAFSHNVMPLYALECARQAALELGQSGDAGWLANEYNDYKAAILTAIRRAVKLEKDGPPYLPAAPTYPEGAVSQTLLAVFPSRLISPDDPLVTGLLAHMERTALQGLPSNMGWLGPSGVWPGESMDVAETYLLRGEVEKTADLLVATMDHSYSTKVWREEMLVDNTLPTACGKPRSDAKNQTGSGDMPEAWAHANLVILLRNMLLREEEGGLHLLSGIPASWIGVGEKISVQDAPTMLGGKLSYTLSYPEAGKMNLDLSPPPGACQVAVHFPLSRARRIMAARVNGQPVSTISGLVVSLTAAGKPIHVEIDCQ